MILEGLFASVLILLGIIFYVIKVNKLKKKYGNFSLKELIKCEKGEYGENSIIKVLNKYLTNHKGYLINDVIINNLKGSTSQIDHILFTSYGIFVIETKNLSGFIYGSYHDNYWTQVLGYETKNKIYNPIRQNKTHCSRISGILNQKDNIYSCIVLVQNNTRHIKNCDNIVHKRRELLKYLNSFNDVVFNDNKIKEMYEKINRYKTNPICSESDHINRIKRNL